MKISSFARRCPVGFVLVVTIVWVVLLLVFMGAASTIFQKPYGDAMTVSIGRLAVTACVLFLAWRLGWLKASVISRLGRWKVWLLALGGLVYFASASLYSFYGRVAFDFSSLLQLPDARTAVVTHFIAGLSEEILFRGLVPFLESVGEKPHPYQRELQRKLAVIYADSATGVLNELLPV